MALISLHIPSIVRPDNYRTGRHTGLNGCYGEVSTPVTRLIVTGVGMQMVSEYLSIGETSGADFLDTESWGKQKNCLDLKEKVIESVAFKLCYRSGKMSGSVDKFCQGL